MSKRGICALLVLLLAISAYAAFPVSEEEAVSAVAKASVVRIDKDTVYKVAVPRPVITNGDIMAGEPASFTFPDSSSGSGFIVGKNGYIVTNAHVVLPQSDEILKQHFVPEVVKAFELEPSVKVVDFLSRNMQITHDSAFTVKVPAFMSGVGVIGKPYPAEIKRVGDPFPGLDLAIVKIDVYNLPTLELGSAEHLRSGNRIIAIGYPFVAQISPAKFDATVTSGIVSSGREETIEGVEMFQMDAAVSYGSSGGPVLDSTGKVVGVITVASVEAQGFNHFIPADEIEEFLSDAFVAPQESVVNKVYERALVHFWNDRYDRAVEDLQAVRDIYPDHPYASNYLLQSRLAVEEMAPGDYNWIFFSVGAFLVVVVIILSIIVLRERHEIEVLRR